MRATPILSALVAALLLALPAVAEHKEGKGARSLGGETVPRPAEWIRIDAEDFEERPVGALRQDEGAVGAAAWVLDTYGTISTTIDVPSAGVAWVDVRARGTHPPDMMNPHMHLLVDGEQRAEWDVRGEWLAYPQAVPLLPGKRELGVDNFNNYRAPVADRPIHVDWLSVSHATLEGSPRVPAGGHVVVDAAEIHDSVTGQLEQTPLARNGTQWRQWGVGCFLHMLVFEAGGEHRLDTRLRGNVHDGVGTRVQIRLDGEELREHHVGDEWEHHDTRFRVERGPHTLEICYDNDEPGMKRNLWLDEFAVASLEGAPASNAPAPAWVSAHGGLANHRHAPSAIDVDTVRTAREVWSYEAAGPVTGTPAFGDGVVYFADHGGRLHAVRAADGSREWKVDLGAGVDSSVALDATRVYAGDMEGWLHARERADGAPAWRVRADEIEGTHLYGSPVVHEGVVYTGVASGQTLIEYEGPQTFRGSVAAFSASEGRLLWKTYTQDEGGLGVSVWSTPAIDPQLGLLFVGTGNSYGEPVGRYTDSILALRLSDGAIVWSYQATKGDAFNARGAPGPDRDFGASPLLFEAAGRLLVGDGDKGGTFYALDRRTGEVVWSRKVDFKVDGVPPARLEGFLGTATFLDGRIHAPTTSRSMVHALDAATGEIAWATELNPLPREYGGRMFGAATAAEGVILQGNALGRLFALDARTGEILVNLSAGGAVQGGVSLAGDRILVPHVGEHLWSGRGGVSAFVVDAKPPPAGTTPANPTGAPPDPAAIREGIPFVGPLIALAAAFAAATLRARRRA